MDISELTRVTMSNPKLQPKNELGQWRLTGDEPLAKQVIGIRLPESIHAVVFNRPDRAEWLRRVIAEAAKREGLLSDWKSE